MYLKGALKITRTDAMKRDVQCFVTVCLRGYHFYGTYMKGLFFLSEMVYKRVRVWTVSPPVSILQLMKSLPFCIPAA